MTTVIDNAVGTAKEALGNAKDALEGAKSAAVGAAEGAAETMKDTYGDAAKNVVKALAFMRHVDMDDMLSLVGLRRKRSPLATIALVGGGVLVGAGITLLLAPVSGEDARNQIRKFVQAMSGRAMDEVGEVKEKAGHIADEVKEKAGHIADEVKDRAGDVKDKAGDVKDKAGQIAGDVKDEAGKAKERVGQAQEKVGEIVGQTQDSEGTEGSQADEGANKGRRGRHPNAQVS